jgi:selenide,water dikinase
LDPALLDKALSNISFPSSKMVLVDSSHADDAGVIKLNDDLALVQTIDFFTPIVDDPYLFGQIAATNALSDIYAMGAKPLSALNIICFPDDHLDVDAFRLITQGGADKVREADAVILGGHSVTDKELKYGLAVTGTIQPESIRLNRNLQIGDVLILTKPIGTGILTTALKNGVLEESDMPEVIESMLMLNKEPARSLDNFDVSACTDITGYGILGHMWEMLNGLNCGVNINVEKIPFFEKAINFARNSMHIPGGTFANQKFNNDHIEFGDIDVWYQNLLFDPQTSGGLLISLPKGQEKVYIDTLSGYSLPVAVIGEVIESENKIFLK